MLGFLSARGYNTNMTNAKEWRAKRVYSQSDMKLAALVLDALRRGEPLRSALRANPLPEGGFLAKHALVAEYRRQVSEELIEEDPVLLAAIRMKPVRTLSGVTTITVLTKPEPCPGACIFCPTVEGMPQSYLPDEPGARRGVENQFDPYRQVSSRLKALYDVGHPIDKIELLILGGSWDAYPPHYREWFVRRCFEALNGENAEDNLGEVQLEAVQARNVTAASRNVGLVVETRPDLISVDGLLHMRRLGVTKIQIGVQSMDDHILELNQRGHTVEETIQAARLMRAAGFKIVAHWMPNLLGATLESDKADYARLWEVGSIQPDELKIYPCQLLESAQLYNYWQQGEYQPYTEQELLTLLAAIKPSTPRYCRINRVVRDIPSTNVVDGSRNTSLRQDVALEMKRQGKSCTCIRCRELKGTRLDESRLTLNDLGYQAAGAYEHFLSFDTAEDRLAGFLRLSLPEGNSNFITPELEGAGIIREVHVFGQSLGVGAEQSGAAQHIGLGSRLIEEAERLTLEAGFQKLAVIAAVGTREYYSARGFKQGELYMVKELKG